MSSSTADLWDEIAAETAATSDLWGAARRHDCECEPVFSPLGDPRYAVGVEAIYEGYLAHYGRPRLFRPDDADAALLLGDTLYAQGLTRVAELGEPAAVADVAELLALCAALRAERMEGDGAAWAASIALLGRGGLGHAREALRAGDAEPLLLLAAEAAGRDAVDRALAAHTARVG